MKHKFLLIYSWLVRTLLFFFPDIPFIMRFRGCLYGIFMKKCGRDFQVTHDVIIKMLENIEVGENVFIGNHSMILGSGHCLVGDAVLIGPNCIIVSGSHNSINGSYRYGKGIKGCIEIKKGAWVAANCTIVSGCVIPENSVLAANSFLNKAMQIPNSIYAGAPAKLIKTLNNND